MDSDSETEFSPIDPKTKEFVIQTFEERLREAYNEAYIGKIPDISVFLNQKDDDNYTNTAVAMYKHPQLNNGGRGSGENVGKWPTPTEFYHIETNYNIEWPTFEQVQREFEKRQTQERRWWRFKLRL